MAATRRGCQVTRKGSVHVLERRNLEVGRQLHAGRVVRAVAERVTRRIPSFYWLEDVVTVKSEEDIEPNFAAVGTPSPTCSSAGRIPKPTWSAGGIGWPDDLRRATAADVGGLHQGGVSGPYSGAL